MIMKNIPLFKYFVFALLIAVPLAMSGKKQKVARPSTRTVSVGNASASERIPGAPDFAYPQTVSKASEKDLDAALMSGNEKGAVRALMNYCLAQAQIGSDNYPEVIEKITTVGSKLKAPQSKSLVNTLLADIYVAIFNNNSYVYNNRKLPLLPVPEDFNEWSGDQFRHVITNLSKESMADAIALQTTPLNEYSNIIDCETSSRVYFPTLYDFVAYKAIGNMQQIGQFSSCFGLLSLSPRSVFSVSPVLVMNSPQAQLITDTYAALLRFHKGNAAPEIYAEIQRIDFAEDNVYYNLSDKAKLTAVDRLMDLYNDYKNNEYSGNVLIALQRYINENPNSKISKKENYNLLQQFKSKYPSFARIGCIDNIISNLSGVSFSVFTPQIVAPSQDFKLSIRGNNANSVTVDIFNVSGISSRESQIKASKLNSLKPVKTFTVNFPGTVPFDIDTTLSVSVPEYGLYVAAPRSKQSNNNRYYDVFHATRLSAGSIKSDSQADIFVIDPMTGQPVDRATLKFFTGNTSSDVGMTDNEGFFNVPAGKSGRYQPLKEKDKYAARYYVYNYIEQPMKDWEYNGNLFTDLAVYHPGDSVQWCAVVYQFKNFEKKLATDTFVKAILSNANNVSIDTVSVTTDVWGRINGKFVVPEGELTGNYSIRLMADNGTFASKSFLVSDYKLPTYYIETNKAASGVPSEGDVTISGFARTYSGVAMAGIPVEAVISASAGSWWMRTNDIEFSTLRDSTDVNGKFSMVLTKEMIANSPAPEGVFTATIHTISLSGESQQTQISFTVSKKYNILSTLPANMDVSHPVNLSQYFSVENSEGMKVSTPLEYILIDKNQTATRGEVSDAINWTRVNGGDYSMKVYAPEVSADTLDVSSLIVYRPNDPYSPVKRVIWTPDSKKTINKGRKTDLNIFALDDETHALITISDRGKGYNRRWVKLHKGSNKVEVSLPDGSQTATVAVCATKNFKTSTTLTEIEAADSRKSLDIAIESFRNRLIPGQQEKWTFRTLNQDSAGVESAVILDMYNKALDDIKKPLWELAFSARQPSNIQLNPAFTINTISNGIWSRSKNNNCAVINSPEFQLYGYSFAPARRAMYLRGTMKMNMASVEYDAAAPMTKSAGLGAVKEELAVENKVYSSVDDAEGAVPQPTPTETEESFSYRQSDASPLAFFHPMLNTDRNGNIEFSFTVPNANTTWNLTALAYDQDMLTAKMQKQLISNKPLMVQPNLPRFLRTGDKAAVAATVMNNGEEAMEVKAITELFDPATNKVISEQKNAIALKPGETSSVAINIDVPSAATFIGYRVKVTNGKYTDGEQAVIPVLPSSQPVVETLPFYLSSDTTEFSMKLPQYPTDSRITLQFCDNPTWYVVTALPGISKAKANTAPEAAASIFSAAVAEGILNSSPQVKKVLKEWVESDQSDSTLVSMLEKNGDLKTFLLQATPFMMDARSDTERMQRLALLFDSKNIKAVYDTNIALLSRLQRSNGGFAWLNQYQEASEWATYSTLTILGRLNELGFMPGNNKLTSMVNKALGYYQNEITKDYRKYPDSDYTDYVMLLDYWPSFKPSLTSVNIVNKTVQKKLAGWKKESVAGKVTSALILARHGYKRISFNILESLRQFAKSSSTQGMYWPSLGDAYSGTMSELMITSRALKAYSLIEPDSKDIDAIRQWLILQKEARDWGNGIAASEVAAAVLLTSPKWLEPAGHAEVTIGNKQIAVTPAEKNLGYFRTNISDMSPSGKELTIKKNDKTPAWGALYSQSTQIMTDIKPASIEALSIEKRLYRQDGDKWVVADHITVGDKVKIELVIHANRAMDYVAIDDQRAACLEPVEQTPTPIWSEGLCFYRENNDEATNIFINRLPKGTYLLTYEMWVNNAGAFSSGIATIQSQYAPQLTAHSAGTQLTASPAR